MDNQDLPTQAETPRAQPVPDPPTEPAKGLVFGRYKILRELGAGGMGRVVLALDTKLDVEVAIKLLPERIAQDPAAVDDLRKEVLRGRALTHPGIVRTYQFEQDDQGAGIAMEYVAGETLAQLRRRQLNACFDAEDIALWIEELCAVLDYAHHEARIVHRDLKPGNIMVAQAGPENSRRRIKVADFGLAAILSDAAVRHSREGIASGTPPYMSPQQARGARPTHLDDIYSLGATIYDLLTGAPPFYQGNITVQVDQLVAPSMTHRRIERGITAQDPIPAAWEKTIADCLAKDPAQRPQSAGEVAARLIQSEIPTDGGHDPLPPPPSPEPRLRLGKFAVASAVVLFLLISWPLFFGGHHASSPPVPLHPIPSPAPVLLPEKSALERIQAATASAPFVNGLKMKLVPVPITGGPTDTAQSKTLVLFATTETTVAAYEHFITAKKVAWTRPDFFQEADHPAVNVSWGGAVAFCAWLTEVEHATQRLPDGARYRLPTDHEWSCAVGLGRQEKPERSPRQKRGEIENIYPWGTQWPPPPRSGNYADEAARKAGFGTVNIENYDDGFAYTCPVEAFPPNALGLFGLGGNASEWCTDWYDPANKDERTLRGGSWADGDELYLRSSFRASARSDEHFAGYGFRCVLEVPDATPSGN